MKKIVAKIKSSSSNKVYKLYREGNKVKCPCIGFHIRKSCIHLKKYKGEIPMSTKSTKTSSSSSSSKKLAAVRGKTTRATIINLLLKKSGHTVSLSTIKASLKKLGFSDAKVSKRLKQKTPQIAAWAKDNGRKLVVKSDGMKLLSA